MRLPARFLTPPSMIGSCRAPPADPGATSSIPHAPQQTPSQQDRDTAPGPDGDRKSLERDCQQEDIIYVMWTSGSTGNAKAVSGTAAGESSLLCSQLQAALLTSHLMMQFPCGSSFEVAVHPVD